MVGAGPTVACEESSEVSSSIPGVGMFLVVGTKSYAVLLNS